MAEIVECTDDATVSPIAMLTGHADDEFGALTAEVTRLLEASDQIRG